MWRPRLSASAFQKPSLETMIDYQEFSSILNRHIFGEEKKDLLERIAKKPERFVGLFRPTKPESKILQNIFQSREIRFGDAMEEIAKSILVSLGYEILDSQITPELRVDLYFCRSKSFYMVEQKIRDDHDSTKRIGQFVNFREKFEFLFSRHSSKLEDAAMWFVDPSLMKNRKYYLREMDKLKSETCCKNIFLFYGSEFFNHLGISNLWDDLLGWLLVWREDLPTMPEIDFDADSNDSFEQIRSLEIKYWRKIIKEDDLWTQGIMGILFRTGETLQRMVDYLKEIGEEKLSQNLNRRINKL